MSSLGWRLLSARPRPPARSTSSCGEGEPMEEEEPAGPLLLPWEPLPLGTNWGTELSEMKAVSALIRQLVPSGLCLPPLLSLVLRASPFSAFWTNLRPQPSSPLVAWTNYPRPSPRRRLAVSWMLPYGMRNTTERDTSATVIGTWGLAAIWEALHVSASPG
jgi:hypothetical protein